MIDRRKLMLGGAAIAGAAVAGIGVAEAAEANLADAYVGAIVTPLPDGMAVAEMGSPILGWLAILDEENGTLTHKPITEAEIAMGVYPDADGNPLVVGDNRWRCMVRSEEQMCREAGAGYFGT